MDWWNLMKQSVTVGAPLLWIGHYGCNNGSYGCTIVMSYIQINLAVSQWLLTFNLCVSVTWPLTCAFHIPCTHTPEIIDMHRGVCDNVPVAWVTCVVPSPHFGCSKLIFSSSPGAAYIRQWAGLLFTYHILAPLLVKLNNVGVAQVDTWCSHQYRLKSI